MVVNINNKTLNVKICITPSEIKNGMMGKRFNSSFNGMLFFLNEGEHNFWMKDCLIPLDIIFINNNKMAYRNIMLYSVTRLTLLLLKLFKHLFRTKINK